MINAAIIENTFSEVNFGKKVILNSLAFKIFSVKKDGIYCHGLHRQHRQMLEIKLLTANGGHFKYISR